MALLARDRGFDRHAAHALSCRGSPPPLAAALRVPSRNLLGTFPQAQLASVRRNSVELVALHAAVAEAQAAARVRCSFGDEHGGDTSATVRVRCEFTRGASRVVVGSGGESVELRPSVYALFGPNGSGKSSLLALLSSPHPSKAQSTSGKDIPQGIKLRQSDLISPKGQDEAHESLALLQELPELLKRQSKHQSL